MKGVAALFLCFGIALSLIFILFILYYIGRYVIRYDEEKVDKSDEIASIAMLIGIAICFSVFYYLQ